MTGKEFAKLVCKEGNFKHFPDDGSQFPYIGKVEENDTIDSLLFKIYKYGERNGINSGMEMKIIELKNY